MRGLELARYVGVYCCIIVIVIIASGALIHTKAALSAVWCRSVRLGSCEKAKLAKCAPLAAAALRTGPVSQPASLAARLALIERAQHTGTLKGCSVSPASFTRAWRCCCCCYPPTHTESAASATADCSSTHINKQPTGTALRVALILLRECCVRLARFARRAPQPARTCARCQPHISAPSAGRAAEQHVRHMRRIKRPLCHYAVARACSLQRTMAARDAQTVNCACARALVCVRRPQVPTR